ncbi:MAG: PaaI family thioesterase [Candidatus Latescibacterota bacterium]
MTKQPASRTCFCCGKQNDVSLKMTWYNDYENNKVRSTITIPEHFNGYPGIVHGGIVAAVLDETSGRAIMLDKNFDNLMMTLNLQVTYRRPTPTQVPLEVTGWVIRQSASRAQVAGEIRLPDGTVTAECTAVVVKPPAQVMDKWEAERSFWKVYDD